MKNGVLLGENVFNWTDRNTVSRFYTSDSFVGTRLYLTSIIFLVISGTIICREYLSLPASDCSQWKKLFAAKYVYIYIYRRVYATRITPRNSFSLFYSCTFICILRKGKEEGKKFFLLLLISLATLKSLTATNLRGCLAIKIRK